MPEIAGEYGLDDSAGVEAGYLAYVRTVQPLLGVGRGEGRRATADYLGLSFLPLVNDAPYNGNPAPEEAAELDALLDWHLLLDVLVRVSDTESLPLVIPQMDWPEGRNKRPKSEVPDDAEECAERVPG